jgi:hypothetical protein
MKKLLLSVLLLLSPMVMAIELEGVKLPDQLEVQGQQLQLNGAGVRKKMVFDVYVAALYTPRQTSDAQTVLNTKVPKRLQLSLLRTVEGRALVQSLKDGLQDNVTATQYAAYADKVKELEQILLQAQTAKTGEVITLDFLPGQGCKIQFQGRVLGVVSGDDFARDLLQIWLGKQPVQPDLKAKLLGG